MDGFNQLSFQSRVSIIRDILNLEHKCNLIEYSGSSGYKPDLWQKENPTITCEIKSADTSHFDLFNKVLHHCGAIANEYSSDIFILVFLGELTTDERSRFQEDFKQFRVKQLFVYDIVDIRALLFQNQNIREKHKLFFTEWHVAYDHIALLLNSFYKAHQGTAAQTLLNEIKNTDFYLKNSKKFFLYDDGSENGIDPIQIFACFNYSNIKQTDRSLIINHLLKALKSVYEIKSDADYTGCPTPIARAIMYNRKLDVQNEIWATFNEIYEGETLDGLNQLNFEHYKQWYGIGIPAFTIFLFWIKSEYFVPLDENTVTFLRTLKLPGFQTNNYYDYRNLCIALAKNGYKTSNQRSIIRTVVKDAYRFSDLNYKGDVLSGSTASVVTEILKDDISDESREKQLKETQEELLTNFKIIALRAKPKPTNVIKKRDHQKNLRPGELYKFYHEFNVGENDTIVELNTSKEIEIFNDESSKLKISISAIVGKNGTGKSTLTEMLYLIINRISMKAGFPSDIALKNEAVYADLFYKTDKLYKISVGENINIWDYRFNLEQNIFELNNKLVDEDIGISDFDFSHFFYNIVVNYSLYGLNSKIIGSWVKPLFHKNDSYQIPIVLNPKRIKGTINVLREEELGKARLLAAVLDPTNLDEENSSVKELITGKVPVFLELKIDTEKQLRKREKYFEGRQTLNEADRQKVEKVFSYLHIAKILANDSIDDVKEYIYCKLASMSMYRQFSDHKEVWTDNGFDYDKLSLYVSDILNDTSHVTFKLKQAINYLKHGSYIDGKNNIYNCIKNIAKSKRDVFDSLPVEKREAKIRTIEFIPPSIFKFNILFSPNKSQSGNSFNELSSGEKQQILSINTIAYHVYNLDSVVKQKQLIKYNYMNIIFDEVELYFHPEMQRTYVSRVIQRLKQLELESARNINIQFVTHSPFILSDIPANNVLMLERDEEGLSKPSKPIKNTFCANIHELLIDGFFLSNTIGEFAVTQIEEIVNFHANVLEADEKQREKLLTEYMLKKSLYDFIVSSIGEEYLSGVLKNHLTDIENKLNKNYFQKEKLKVLELEVERLRKQINA